MFDIGASELLLTVIVAIVVIGPKDLPRALRLAGGWIGKIRRVSGHFRSGIEEMIRQAELEEMEQKWREKNAAIMLQETGADTAAESGTAPASAAAEAALPSYSVDAQEHISQVAGSEMAEAERSETAPEMPQQTPAHQPVNVAAPELPLGSPKARP